MRSKVLEEIIASFSDVQIARLQGYVDRVIEEEENRRQIALAVPEPSVSDVLARIACAQYALGHEKVDPVVQEANGAVYYVSDALHDAWMEITRLRAEMEALRRAVRAP